MNKDCINYNLSIFLSAGTGHAAMTMAFHIDSHYIVTIIPSCALCERAVGMYSVPAVCAPVVPPLGALWQHQPDMLGTTESSLPTFLP